MNYIVNDNSQYLSESNYYAEVGSYVHKILEMIFSGKLNVNDALQYYIDNYSDNVLYETRKSTMEKNYELIADYFASVDTDWLQEYEIIGVEQGINFQLNGHQFIGYIDLLLRDREDGKIVIVDHKSTEYPFKQNGDLKKKSEQSYQQYKNQMYLYCYGIHELYGEYPKEIWWNHFKEGKFAKIQFSQTDYQESLEWFMKSIVEINKETGFEPNQDFFYCNNLCDFRRSCEYNKFNSGSD